jgi:hypothetical protein
MGTLTHFSTVSSRLSRLRTGTPSLSRSLSFTRTFKIEKRYTRWVFGVRVIMSCDGLMTASHVTALMDELDSQFVTEAGARSYDTTMSDVDRNVLKAMRAQVATASNTSSAWLVLVSARTCVVEHSAHTVLHGSLAFLHNLHPSRMQPTTGRREVKRAAPRPHRGATTGRVSSRCHFKAWSNAEPPASLLKHLPRLRQRRRR